MSFATAVLEFDNKDARTTNGARTNKSSLSACVDLFFIAAASRGKDISKQFIAAYKENREIALRLLLWLRDCRGGAGEREQFRKLWRVLHDLSQFDAYAVLSKVPEVGRWDDVLAAPGGNVRDLAFQMISLALSDGDRLAAKWMPRKGDTANELRKFLGLTPKAYRKLLVGLSDTVEQKMCAKEWNSINFAHVPSVAAARYQKAFGRNAADAYAAYKASLVKGETKVNASTIFPHDVLLAFKRGDRVVAEQQWKALPNYLGDGDEGILPLIDVSGSMTCRLGQDPKTTTTCRDVSIGLGLYIAERQRGAFRNVCFTFSSDARAVVLSDKMDLAQKMRAVDDGYAGSTNIEAAFRRILEIAKDGKVAPKDMPKKLLILSDMEFNQAVSDGRYSGGYGGYLYGNRTAAPKQSALDMVRAAYAAAGYEMPQIVFWNLNARAGNCPATIKDDGTALVSGYSPAILKAILKGKNITPISVMLDALMVDRYAMYGLDGVEAQRLAA